MSCYKSEENRSKVLAKNERYRLRHHAKYKARRNELRRVKMQSSDNVEKTKKYMKKWRANNKDKIKINAAKYELSGKAKEVRTKSYTNKSPETRFKQSIRQATRRGFEWSLTFEYYLNIIQNPCYYCNDYFDKRSRACGLDRKNSELGYIESNVVSCCTFCNTFKSNILSENETLEIISFLIKNRGRK
jgi:hypothetical protein